MKTIATIATTALLLAGGLFSTPASAAEVVPPTCEETVQEWQARALTAESEADTLRAELAWHDAAWASQMQAQAGLKAVDEALRANLEQANESVDKMVKVAERRRVKLIELRATLRELRESR